MSRIRSSRLCFSPPSLSPPLGSPSRGSLPLPWGGGPDSISLVPAPPAPALGDLVWDSGMGQPAVTQLGPVDSPGDKSDGERDLRPAGRAVSSRPREEEEGKQRISLKPKLLQRRRAQRPVKPADLTRSHIPGGLSKCVL